MAKGEQDFFKFLRTRHIFDAGGNGVTRDDLVLSKKEAEQFLKSSTLLLEEKVDGANLGISIGKDYQIKVQNRSHYVNSSTHRQFGTLDSWIEQHSVDLFSVLTPDKHVLFGEWLFAKHSVYYTDLPDYFLAFDIFDKQEKRYLSASERNEQLKDTNIQVIRTIGEESNVTKQRLLNLLDTKSTYYDGYIEGLVIRKVDDTAQENRRHQEHHFFESRVKIVRPDFLQQIDEQWTRQKFEKNRLRHY